jgi:hypothetical protein
MTNYDKWQNWPLVREGAPNLQDYNFQNIINIWSWALTDWLTVSRNVTLTLTESLSEGLVGELMS